MIQLDGISKSFGRSVAVRDVTCDLSVGVTVLLGKNGAGKSTLCRLLAGAERADRGVVVVDGSAVESRADWQVHRRRSGWLPQAFSAPGEMTVSQFLVYAAWLKEVPRPETSDRVDEALAATDLLGLRRRRLGQLSGGMWRRAGIAAAIVGDPEVLILDEPTTGLDPEQRGQFHRLVQKLGRERIVLLSTHLLEDVSVLAEHIVVLDEGRVAFTGEASGLADRGVGADRQERLRSGFLAAIADGPLPA